MDADDRAFDLLRAVADHADLTGLTRTTQLVERAMDALLVETGRVNGARARFRDARAVGKPSVAPNPAGPRADTAPEFVWTSRRPIPIDRRAGS